MRRHLERLRESGFQLAILTNSRLQAAEEALRQADLRDYFFRVLSADMAQRYKPAPEVASFLELAHFGTGFIDNLRLAPTP